MGNKGNKKKYLLLIVAVMVLVATGLCFYLYNKPAIDVKNARADKVAATALYAVFIKDSTAAKLNYTNKIMEVTGMVTLTSVNQQHQQVVLLKTNSEGAAVNCTLEENTGGIKPGTMVSIRGICNGLGEGDADLGIMGDVYLVRCYVSK